MKRALHFLTSLAAGFVATAVLAGISYAVPAGKWKYYDTQTGYYRFYYQEFVGTYDPAQTIAFSLSETYRDTLQSKAYATALSVLGQKVGSPTCRIPVYVFADGKTTSTYNPVGAVDQYLVIPPSVQSCKLADRWIELHGDTGTTWYSLRQRAATLCHETTHWFFDDFSKLYRMPYYWDDKDLRFVQIRVLTEGLAWYAGSSRFEYGPRYTYSDLQSKLAGYQVSWASSAGRYCKLPGYGTWQSRDTWQLIAIGYVLAKWSVSYTVPESQFVGKLMSNLALYCAKNNDNSWSYKDATYSHNTQIGMAFAVTFGVAADMFHVDADSGKTYRGNDYYYRPGVYRYYYEWWNPWVPPDHQGIS